MDDEPEQEHCLNCKAPTKTAASGRVSSAGRDVWCQKLGPVAKVAEVMSQWLGASDYDEVETAR